MSSKQFAEPAAKTVHEPIHRSPVEEEKEQVGVESKRPFAPIPALLQRAAQAPHSITPDEANMLQRTIGNQAIGRLLRVQAKLTVGPVGDKYEQEADAVAKQVVQRINAPKATPIQRQEDEEEVQLKPFAIIQRREEEEEEELQMQPFSTMGGGAVSPDIESDIQRARGGGRPLSPNTQTSMSRAFNADFTGVRIHTDNHSNRLNHSIQARAFTTGQDIFFRDGAYNPNNSAGQELLAHELTHTIQQGGSPRSVQPKRAPKPRNPFLLGGLGFVSPHQIQRVRALSTKSQSTYKKDPDNENKVLSGRIYGKRSSNHTIKHYQLFDVTDNQDEKDGEYHKITTAGNSQGEFVHQSNYSPIVAVNNETKVIEKKTHIKNGDNWREAEPGDLLSVTGQTDGYYIGSNQRTNPGISGSVRKDKVRPHTDGLAKTAVQLTEAATIKEDVPFYRPLAANRTQSVGVDDLLDPFQHSGDMLTADFTVAGIDPSGKDTLILAQHNGTTGYVEKEKVRQVTALQGANNTPLPAITESRVVTNSTKLRQMQKNDDGPFSLKSTYQLQPGDILEHTANSRSLSKDDRQWATEMKWQGHTLGMVDIDKSAPLSDDQKTALKLNAPITTAKNKSELTQVLVTADTHLRDLGKRQYTFAIGEKIGDKIKKNNTVYVDFSIKGVDKTLDDGWIYAQTKDNQYGYIRESKVTKPEEEGKIKSVALYGHNRNIEGNEIPDNNRYIYQKDDSSGHKRGDHFSPIQNQAVATSTTYHNLHNIRTGENVAQLPKKDVMLASPALTKVAQTDKTALILKKAHLREPIEPRVNNSGVSTNKIGDALRPGDNLQVDFASAGVYEDEDTGWIYAKMGANTFGYIRASSVRESSVEQLRNAQLNVNLNRYLPAYVSSDTYLRDQSGENKKQEKKKAGDQIQVNFTSHPPNNFTKPDHWLKVKNENDAVRYIREHKVTTQFSQPENNPPQSSSSSLSGTAYGALKLLTDSVSTVNFNLGNRPVEGLYKGIKQVRGIKDGEIENGIGTFQRSDNTPTHGGEDYNIAISGIAGGLAGLMGTVEGLIDLFGTDRSWKQRMLGALKIAQSGLAGVAMSAWGANTIYKLKDSRVTNENNTTREESPLHEAFDVSKEVFSWSFGIANAIKAIKSLYLSIYSFMTSHKKTSKIVGESIKHVLEAGLMGVKAAKFVADLFKHSSAGRLAISVPFIGVAVDMANIVLSAFKTYRGHDAGGKAKRRLDNDNLKNKVIGAFAGQQGLNTDDPEHEGDANHLFWKESRGVRSFNTMFRKDSYMRLNPKIMFAIRNRTKLDKRVGVNDRVYERSPFYINSDYYQIVLNDGTPTGDIVAVINGHHITISRAAEKAIREYELVSKVQEVSKKKKIYGIEGIEKGVLNLIGNVLNMGGPTAMAGALVKGITSAIDSGFNFSRFINKQMDNRSGKKSSTHLKYGGRVKGTDKSQSKKQREYYDHAVFIMQEIGDLASPTNIIASAQDQQTLRTYKKQYDKVHDHVEMTGVYTELFYGYAGKPKEQVDLLVEALGER